jgi:hypothetical protein
MRIEIRSAGKITVSVVASLVLSFLTQLTLISPAHACSAPPEQPRIKIVWGETGGPTFEIKPSKIGSLPTTIQYTYAFLKAGDSKFGEWADWVSTSISSVDTLIMLKAPSSSTDELISVSANALNACGNYQYTLSFRLLTYETLKPATAETLKMSDLNIAKDLPLSQVRIPKRYFYPNNVDIPQTLSTKNSSVCTYDEKAGELLLLSAGNCEITISQNNEKLSTPNPDMTYTINILPHPSILPGVKKDRPDDIKGFQVHFIYVTLKNKPSSNFLESGLINNWLDLANAWLKRKIGKELIFDTYQGAHDVSILESRYTEKELLMTSDDGELKSKNSPLELLRAEFALQNGSQMLGKNMFFIIDGNLSKDYCGLADRPGNTGLSTPGSSFCWDSEFGFIASTSKFSSPSSAIAHELIHNFGVGHPCENPSDLMYGTGCNLDEEAGERVIDEDNSLYVGSDKAGVNILDFKVWKDGSGKRNIPLNEVCYVGEPCLVSNGYWSSPQGNLVIQERIRGKWKDLQSFKVKKIGSKKYAFNASIIPREKGIHTYREYIAPTKNYSAYVGKAFTRNVVY